MSSRITFCFLFIIAIFPLAFRTKAQCKGYAKENCFPKLAPFTLDGQVSSAILLAGNKIQTEMILYSDQNYRVLVCAQGVLGKVSFKMLDMDKNIIFNSKENGDTDHWDFNLQSTQQVIIEVEAPSVNSPDGYVPRGCVALIVGFKEKSKFLKMFTPRSQAK